MLPRATAVRARGTRSTTKLNLKGSTGGVAVAERIFELTGREFDIGKPSVLAKVCVAWRGHTACTPHMILWTTGYLQEGRVSATSLDILVKLL